MDFILGFLLLLLLPSLALAATAGSSPASDPFGALVAKITADGGPTLKRSRSRAFGRAAPIRKRTTHINITLSAKTT